MRTVPGKRYKALFLATWYPSIDKPYAGIFIKRMADAVALYDDVVVLHIILESSSTIEGRVDVEWDSEVSRSFFESESPPVIRVRHRSPRSSAIKYWNIVAGANRAYREIIDSGFEPDIVHAHVYKSAVPATALGTRYRKPIVVTEHSTDFLRIKLTRMHARLARITYNRAAMVMPVGQALLESIRRYGVSARFKIIPNVIDIDRFYPIDTNRDKASKFRILTVASLDSKKGIWEQLEALRELYTRRDDWRINIIGDGPLLQKYRELVTKPEYGGRVCFLGPKHPDVVAEYMRKADVFVLASLYETFSVATAEALACGVPVVVTASGGPEEFVRSEDGLLVPPGDPHAMCAAIDTMLSNLDAYSSHDIALNARSRFAPEIIGAQIHSAYETVLKESD